jgi:acyl-CoA thioesterase
MSTLASAFERATAVEPLGDCAWRGTCEAAWNTQLGPNGGYIAAVVLRAMIAELDAPDREPRSLTCHYLRPPRNGELRVEAAVEREGRTMSTVSARVAPEVPTAAAAIVDEPVLAPFRSTTAAGGFFEEDGELWSRDGVLLAQSRQLALLLAEPR